MPNYDGTPVAAAPKMSRLGAVPHAGQSGDLSINNVVRSIGRGVLGVGPYLDEMNAATNAAIAPAINPLLPDSWRLPGDTYEERYNTSLAMQRGMDEAFDEQHPYISEGLQGVGEVASTLALQRSAPGIGKVVLGNVGKGLPARIAATIASNLGMGAVEGFGDGEGGLGNRAEQAVHDAVVEALTGLGMMPVEAGAEAGRKAGAKALARALLKVRGR
ncbi:hypothetical protein K6M90_09745 [Rhizobium sp. 9T]|uniref:hypothetical protein n=1 Tax=Rhizobium croatiense TaxID=2867516 RepID=UPI001C932AF9|nr:hypothetical protein [Rhizobium croatiense]MBY4607933.1 hypothetical protein [Rhizobium croatiense]